MKGYPRSRFEIVDQSQIQEITTTVVPNPVPIIMAAYTSDKGPEGWQLMTSFSDFAKTRGANSFARHGQQQLTVAEALRSGSFVFGKRIVADDAKLANTTVKARLVVVDGVTYIYLYTSSHTAAGTHKDAVESGYGNFDPHEDGVTDIPLFTVTPKGRGTSNISFRIVPGYAFSKSSSYLRYSFEVIENHETIESISFCMNPDIVVEDVSQALDSKVKANSHQVDVTFYYDSITRLVIELAKTAKTNADPDSVPIPAVDLINMDFINGRDRRGNDAIGGVVTKAQSNGEDAEDLWVANKPADIEVPYSLAAPEGIPLANGSFGELGFSPMDNWDKMQEYLLGVFGKNTESDQFDTIIYDLDANKLDCIFDCQYSYEVKNAIIDLIEFRGDMAYFVDLPERLTYLNEILEAVDPINYSRYSAVYHNYVDVINPYDKKQITVSMPYLICQKMASHLSSGIGRPFAGFANNMYFPEIIEGSVNFLPVTIPGEDQKQKLVDANINYISYYDGTPVMETMYTNQAEYTQLSFIHNIMGVQEVIKAIRTRCPYTRYTFLDGDDLEEYIEDATKVINQYSTNFKSISIQYMADEAYEANNIFYATIRVQFHNFVQEEYFKVIAIS